MQALIKRPTSIDLHKFKIEFEKEKFSAQGQSDLKELNLSASLIRANTPYFKKVIGISGVISCMTLSLNISEISPIKSHYISFKLASDSANVITLLSMVRIAQFGSNAVNMKKVVSKTEDQAEIETIFKGLAKIWKDSTRGLSITSRRFLHPTYKAILRMGPETVPFILKELQERPDWWFDALEFLTNFNPANPNDSFEDASNAWIEWGKKKNLIS